MVYQNHKSRSSRVRRGVQKGPFLALYFSAALFTLTIWLFGPLVPRSPVRWRPQKELCFDWSASLSTGVFLSIQANMRPPSQWIPTKLTSNPTSIYLAPTSVSIQLQLFLGSLSTALFFLRCIFAECQILSASQGLTLYLCFLMGPL